MANERLMVQLLLEAGQYKREAKEAAAATGQISTSAQAAAKSTTGLTTKMGGAASALKTVGTTATVAIAGAAVAAVGKFVGDSVRAFSDLEQSVGGVEATFGGSADQINRWAAEAAGNIGLSESAANTAATRIGAMLQNFGFSAQEAADESIRLVELGADLAATFGGTVPEAVAAVAAALRGETDPIERYGVSLNVAAIEAHALEEGLADTKDEVTGQTKAMAALDLITEQTAKSSGQFARELDTVAGKAAVAAANVENMKARAGEALVPFTELTTQIQVLGAQALGSVASSIQNLLGQISPAQDAINQFEILTGATADTLAAMVTINREAGVSFEDLAAEMVLTAEEAVPLNEKQIAFLESIGLTTEEIQALDEVLAGEHAAAVGTATTQAFAGREAWFGYAEGVDEATGATEAGTTATETATDALRAHQDALRAQTDPLFAARDAARQHADAQTAVNDAVTEFGEGSPEHLDALADLTVASFDLRDAQADARVQTDLTKDAFIDQAVNAGIARDEAKLLADQLYGLSGLRLDPIQLAVEIRELRRGAGSMAGGPQEYHSGGVVRGDYVGQEIMARVLVGETIIPIGHNASLAAAPSSPGGGTHIEFHGGIHATGTPAKIAHDVGQQVALEMRMA